MATQKQIAANRKNAQRSTGPRTNAGKATAAKNSIRHGLLGKFGLMEGEAEEEFYQLLQQARAALKPEGAVEEIFVDRWVKDSWRLNRLDKIEPALLVNQNSFDDLPILDLLKVITIMHRFSNQSFDELLELEMYLNNESKDQDGGDRAKPGARRKLGSESRRATESAGGVGFSSVPLQATGLEHIILEHLSKRDSQAELAANKAQSTDTEADADGDEHIKATLDKIARAFTSNREPLSLALRYRTKIERSRDNALHELQRLQAARQGQVVTAPGMVDVNMNLAGRDETEI